MRLNGSFRTTTASAGLVDRLAGLERKTGLRLPFVYRRAGPSLLVAPAPKGATAVPIFLLVAQVKLPKRLDPARDAERAHDAVPGAIVANWVEAGPDPWAATSESGQFGWAASSAAICEYPRASA